MFAIAICSNKILTLRAGSFILLSVYSSSLELLSTFVLLRKQYLNFDISQGKKVKEPLAQRF